MTKGEEREGGVAWKEYAQKKKFLKKRMTVKMTDHLKRWPTLPSRESNRRRDAWRLEK